MMGYGRNEAKERLSQLLDHPRSLALTGPLMSIMINIVLVLVALAGLVLAAHGQRAGQPIVFAAMIWSTTHTILIRAKHSGNAAPDERERALATEAMAVGGYSAATLVAVWFLVLGVFADAGMWFPQSSREWQALGFFVIGLTTQITNIAAAWRTPPYAADLLDED
jgi:hypothetical protein